MPPGRFLGYAACPRRGAAPADDHEGPYPLILVGEIHPTGESFQTQTHNEESSDMAAQIPAIDADGHVLEREERHPQVSGAALGPAGRPPLACPTSPGTTALFGTLGGETAVAPALSPGRRSRHLAEDHGRARDGARRALPHRRRATSRSCARSASPSPLCRAANDLFASEYNAISPRVQAVGVLPMQDPAAAAAELRRGVDRAGPAQLRDR